MKNRTLIIAASLLAAVIIPITWYALTDGGTLPTRAELRDKWLAHSQTALPTPRPGEQDAWKIFQTAHARVQVIDQQVWAPQGKLFGARDPQPDFSALTGKPPTPAGNEEDDRSRLTDWQSSRDLAEKCMAAYRQQGLFPLIDAVVGVKTGTQPHTMSTGHLASLATDTQPHLAHTRAFARINAARMRIAARDNDLPEFTAAYRTNLALARLTACGGTHIDRMVAQAVEALTIHTSFAVVATRPDPDWLSTIESHLGEGTAAVPVTHSTQAERLIATDMILLAKESGQIGPSRVVIDAWAAASGVPRIGTPAGNIQELNKQFDALTTLAALPRQDRASKHPDLLKQLDGKPHHIMVSIAAPAHAVFLRSNDTISAHRSALALTIHIERHRLQHGTLPATLSELTGPALTQAKLATLAADPWGTGLLGYRPSQPADATPLGFILYTVGHDGQDNGGRELPQQRSMEALTPKGAGFDYIINRPND